MAAIGVPRERAAHRAWPDRVCGKEGRAIGHFERPSYSGKRDHLARVDIRGDHCKIERSARLHTGVQQVRDHRRAVVAGTYDHLHIAHYPTDLDPPAPDIAILHNGKSDVVNARFLWCTPRDRTGYWVDVILVIRARTHLIREFVVRHRVAVQPQTHSRFEGEAVPIEIEGTRIMLPAFAQTSVLDRWVRELRQTILPIV